MTETFIPEGEFWPANVVSLDTAQFQQRPWTHSAHRVTTPKRQYGGSAVKLAVIDTGVDVGWKSDLSIIGQRDYIRGNGDMGETYDDNGHGTHCASIAGACSNDIGVVGVTPGIPIISYKVLDGRGFGTANLLAKGIFAAVNDGCQIMSISIGMQQPDKEVQEAINHAHLSGCMVFCAAGNDGPRPDTMDWPARFEFSKPVGSVNQRMEPSRFSSRSSKNAYWFGGEQIVGLLPNKRIGELSGTSMACPGVAGFFAMALDFAIDLGWDSKDAIEKLQLLFLGCELNDFQSQPGTRGGAMDCERAIRKLIDAFEHKPEPDKPDPSLSDYAMIRWDKLTAEQIREIGRTHEEFLVAMPVKRDYSN